MIHRYVRDKILPCALLKGVSTDVKARFCNHDKVNIDRHHNNAGENCAQEDVIQL